MVGGGVDGGGMVDGATVVLQQKEMRITYAAIENRMVRPWLKDENGNRKKRGGPKKQLAAATTRKSRPDGKPHGVMPKRRRGNGWSAKK